MITHVVMMKLTDKSPDVTGRVRDSLMALPAKIAQIRHYEVGINAVESARAYDIVLISKFDSLEDLAIYNDHAEHQAALVYIRSVLEGVAAVDYEG